MIYEAWGAALLFVTTVGVVPAIILYSAFLLLPLLVAVIRNRKEAP